MEIKINLETKLDFQETVVIRKILGHISVADQESWNMSKEEIEITDRMYTEIKNKIDSLEL